MARTRGRSHDTTRFVRRRELRRLMATHVTPVPAGRPRLGAWLARGLGYFVLWVVLMGWAPDQLLFGAVTAVVAAWVSLKLLPAGTLRIRPWAPACVGAALSVAIGRRGRRCRSAGVRSATAVAPGFIVYRPRVAPGMARTAVHVLFQSAARHRAVRRSRRRRRVSLPRCWPADRRTTWHRGGQALAAIAPGDSEIAGAAARDSTEADDV